MADIFKWLLMAMLLVLGQSGERQYRIESSAMEPALKEGQLVIVEPIDTNKIQRFDIIFFDSPDVAGEIFVKRVIGLPGETVEIRKNKIYINDKELFEPFESVALDDRYHFGPLKLDGDEFFFLGDNRPNSKDSRIFGAIPAKLIRYKIKE